MFPVLLMHLRMLQAVDSDTSAHSPHLVSELRKQLGEAQQQARRLGKLQQQSAIPHLDLVGFKHTLCHLIPDILLSASICIPQHPILVMPES